jgi:hypothetical protein
MRTFAACATGGIAAVIIVMSFGVGLHAERAPDIARAAKAQSTLYDVDRTHKGSRLQVQGSSVREINRRQGLQAPQPTPTAPQPDLVGCDPAFSPLAASSRSNFPARCVS